jgi:hypothetical protein
MSSSWKASRSPRRRRRSSSTSSVSICGTKNDARSSRRGLVRESRDLHQRPEGVADPPLPFCPMDSAVPPGGHHATRTGKSEGSRQRALYGLSAGYPQGRPSCHQRRQRDASVVRRGRAGTPVRRLRPATATARGDPARGAICAEREGGGLSCDSPEVRSGVRGSGWLCLKKGSCLKNRRRSQFDFPGARAVGPDA